MRVYVCSDTHVGDGGQRDQWTLELLHRWVDSCVDIAAQVRPGDAVVLAGDILELWAHRPQAVLASHWTRQFWRALLPILAKGARVIYCVGNHDDWILANPAACSGVIPAGIEIVYQVIIDGTLFLHGHQFDPANSDHSWVGRVVTGAGAALGTISRRAYAWARTALQRLEGSGRYSRIDRHRDRALGAMQEAGCRRVVTGHTHVRQESGPYLDAGMWSRDGWLILRAKPDSATDLFLIASRADRCHNYSHCPHLSLHGFVSSKRRMCSTLEVPMQSMLSSSIGVQLLGTL